jgi:zinc transport system substrate-binding protein
MKRFHWFLLLPIFLISCGRGTSPQDKPVISVSILPQRFFIEAIAGDLLEVNVMIPPGASPATYEPTSGQLARLSRSPLYMQIGNVEFELSWMEKIKSANPQMHTIDLSRGIDLISDEDVTVERTSGHTHNGADPHIWMSPVNARIIARNVYAGLMDEYPEEEERFTQGLMRLEHQIDSLHTRIAGLLSGRQSNAFMIYHPALTYFARDYHLEQYSLEIGGKVPSPAHMKEMTDLGLEKHIHVILIQKQFDQRNAEVLAEEIGAEIIQIDPLDPDWLSQMGHIADQLNRFL